MPDTDQQRNEERSGDEPVDDAAKRAAELADTDPVEKDMTEEEKKRFRGGR